MRPPDLLPERLHILRQQARQVEGAALVGGKGRALVEAGRVEDGLALESALDGPVGVEGELGVFAGGNHGGLFPEGWNRHLFFLGTRSSDYHVNWCFAGFWSRNPGMMTYKWHQACRRQLRRFCLQS
jgi:hypothetical protein